MTIGEKLIARGERRGREKGREEGRETARELLLDLMSTRFGPLPASVADTIADANTVELHRWARRALRANTIDEIFAPEH